MLNYITKCLIQMKIFYANSSITLDTTIDKDDFEDLKDFAKEMNIDDVSFIEKLEGKIIKDYIDQLYEIELNINILSNLE